MLFILLFSGGCAGESSLNEASGDNDVSRIAIPDDIREMIAQNELQEEDSDSPPELKLIEDAPEEEAEPENEAAGTAAEDIQEEPPADKASVDEDGTYDSREEVSLYIHTYGRLPSNYITRREAQELGWAGGSVENVAPGKCIGGSRFGNYEGRLPDKKGRTYYECDIDTLGASGRGAKRIVYSNDGLIYYTDDHYETFELLYDQADNRQQD